MKTWTILITSGTSVSNLENVLNYELLDLKAGVYHKFSLEDGSVLYVNDFGIRSIQVMPTGTKVMPRGL
jgi:hypothetical protein